jgi:hypothetical protein
MIGRAPGYWNRSRIRAAVEAMADLTCAPTDSPTARRRGHGPAADPGACIRATGSTGIFAAWLAEPDVTRSDTA